MKNLFKRCNPLTWVLLISMTLIATQSNGQLKPSASGYASVNGVNIYYETYGEGKPLILLHGAFMDIESNWGQLLPELVKTRKVIAIDMQGHGRSPYSDRQLSIKNFAADVMGVMDYLKIDSADMVGYSMGGSVAYQFAVLNPKRLKKLVVISSTYKTAGWLTSVSGAFKNFKLEFFDDTPMKTGYDAVAPDKTKWRKFVEQMIGFMQVPFNVGDANIAKIASPVLIIAGDNDGLDKVELAKTYQLLGGGIAADMAPMPKSQLAIVPAQAHVSLMMQTETILHYLEGFLK
jgi:pimeloyl-ACP methyl ester carboxylesterase